MTRSECSAPVAGWAEKCAGPSPRTPSSSSWPPSTLPWRASTSDRSPASTGPGLQIASDVEDLERSGAEVAVDFTVADAAVEHMRWCASHGVHAVVGTTGIAPADVEELEALFGRSSANCVIAANFAIGAVLMMRFAELAAPFMDGVEIIELHHDGKLDAPSGTALHTADRLDQARRAGGGDAWPADRTASEVVVGARGGRAPGESASTPSGSPASWHTRKCSSEPSDRACPFVTTPMTARRSCPG